MRTEPICRGAALGLAILFGLQVYLGSLDESVTWDEPGYIAAGYTNWIDGDYRLNADHPPLMQKLQALPLLWLPVSAPPLSELQWGEDPNPRATQGRALFFESGNDPLRLTRWGRAPVMLLGVLLIVCIYGFGREFLDPEAALLATALAALDPNLIAHAKLATEDLGCTALMLAAVWAWWRWLETPKLRRALLCGVTFALALLSKYTALLLLPIGLVLMWLAWRRRPPGLPRTELAGQLAAMAALTLALINFAYGPGFHLDRYVAGIFRIYPEVSPDYRFYFWGMVSDTPFWYHAVVSVLIKTPLSVWALLGMAALTLSRSRQARGRLWPVLLPAAVVLLVACFDRTNPGIRRVLPALPFLLLCAGFAIRQPIASWVRVLAWLLVLASGVEAMRVFPHHLSYLNPAVGGPDRGPYVFDESNIDWGQDLPSLARWQAQHLPSEPLTLLYFGNADPAAYGVRAVPLDLARLEDPESGTVAVSAHYLAFFRKLQAVSGRDTDWLSKYEPIAKAGYSIYLYHFPDAEGSEGQTGRGPLEQD